MKLVLGNNHNLKFYDNENFHQEMYNLVNNS